MDVTYDAASSTLYLDLLPGVARTRSLLTAHHKVLIDLDLRSRTVGVGLVLTSRGALSPGGCAAIARYCPDLVGTALRPNWGAVQDHLLQLAGEGERGLL